MRKIFFVKKDPELPGSDDNWMIMNGYEFARFMETEEGQKRKDCFAKIGAAGDDDDILYVECGRDKAREAKAEQNRSDYFRMWKEESGYETISLDAPIGISADGDEMTLLEMIADESAVTEDIALDGILKKELTAALAGLNPLERDMMLSVYATNEDMTVNRYALQHGLTLFSAYAVHKRALRKLRFHFRLKRLI